MADLQLVELDSVEILVIVDNELDPISASPNSSVQQTGGMKDIAINSAPLNESDRGSAIRELRMDHICCSAHGLSLMITGVKGEQRHTILFDTGPEESAWERNVKRLRADIGTIEAIQLSHWHRDHSGGMLQALRMIHAAKPGGGKVRVDLHPSRPHHRGLQPPGMPPVSLEADPTFEEVATAGGEVVKSDQPHTLFEKMFMVSGEIPRVTEYEKGLRFGVRFDPDSSTWSPDTLIQDERFLMCKIKGESVSKPPRPKVDEYFGIVQAN